MSVTAQLAEQQLRAQYAANDNQPPPPGDATPERIAKAGTDFYIGSDKARRFADSPLQRLATRGGLYPDTETNKRLLEAGERYFEDWYISNMSSIAAFDPTRVFVGGGDFSPGMPVSERQAIARSAHRGVTAAIGRKYMEVVDAVVLQEQGDFEAIGRKASGMASPHSCRAIATERLTAGLYLLAKHYGLIK